MTKGKAYTVRYEAVNAMLLNEFLKEHRKNEEQEATIAELKSGMTALAATVKEQASQIQKVSAQLATASPSRGGLEAKQIRHRTNPPWRTCAASGEQSLKPRPHQQKQQHFNNQPSRFTAWRLFVSRGRPLATLLSSPVWGMVNHDASQSTERPPQQLR